ncbi:MAG: hypothetical protein IPH79_04020 [Sphingomonadales bacterium]|nr:hypothetical protein [Sphingomonadales bacterium]
MASRNFRAGYRTYPECDETGTIDDGKTTLKARATRRIWFNRTPYMNFRSKADAQPASPYRLQFSVKP